MLSVQSVSVDSACTIGQLKQAIAAEHSIPMERQALLHFDTGGNDDETYIMHCVINGSPLIDSTILRSLHACNATTNMDAPNLFLSAQQPHALTVTVRAHDGEMHDIATDLDQTVSSLIDTICQKRGPNSTPWIPSADSVRLVCRGILLKYVADHTSR